MSQDISAINNALNDIERESDEEDGNDGHRAESNSDQVAAVAAALVEAVDSLNIDLPMTPQSQGRTPSSGSSASGGFEKAPTAMKRKRLFCDNVYGEFLKGVVDGPGQTYV
jgi:hypothetical protein